MKHVKSERIPLAVRERLDAPVILIPQRAGKQVDSVVFCALPQTFLPGSLVVCFAESCPRRVDAERLVGQRREASKLRMMPDLLRPWCQSRLRRATESWPARDRANTVNLDRMARPSSRISRAAHHRWGRATHAFARRQKISPSLI